LSKQALNEKNCVSCIGSTPAITEQEAAVMLAELGVEWSINAKQHLYREYRCKNFLCAMEYANKIAVLAEQQHHHPNLTITWGKCQVEIWTHAINGLSENDFILAAKIEQTINKS